MDGEGVQVVGQDRPAGPDPLALVTLEAAASQPVAALELADTALAAGAVASQAPAGASGALLGAPRDERARGRQPGQGLGGRAGHKPAVQRDLTRSKAEAVQFGGGLVQQTVLARVARRGGRRQDIAAGAASGVGGDLSDLGDVAELVGLPSLPLRIGRASGSLSDTNRSLIFSPRSRCWIWVATRWQRPANSSSCRAARSLDRAPRPRAAARAWAASARASRIERAITRPALAFNANTSSVLRPVRRASVLEIPRTVLPICRDRSTTRTACPRSRPASLRPSRASARAPCQASTASVGYRISASTTVESIRTARTANRVSRWALPITTRVSSATTSAPSRRTSLRTVDSSATRSVNASRQNRRRCSESDTSRTNVSYPQPVRCLTTISRTKLAIGIVGRP